MQYMKVEVSGLVTLALLSTTSLKKQRKIDLLKDYGIRAKLNLNLNSTLPMYV